MLRAAIIAGCLIVLVCAAIFGSGLLEKKRADVESPLVKECNLLTGPCGWSDKKGQWIVELSVPANSAQAQNYVLTVTTPDAPERFLAVLRGESMYMGEYPVLLSKQVGRNDRYVARFTSPICSTGDDMIWRVDLQQGQNVIGHIPIKMVFRADHP